MAQIKSKSIKLLFAAIGFGVLAALLAVVYLKAREAALRAKLTPDEQMVQVVVANRNLVKGTVVEPDRAKFAVRPIPKEYVHDDAVTAGEFAQIEGKKLVENLGQGKPLLHSFLDDDFPRDFSDTIPLKRRAMTVQVDEVNSVSGFIRPGNRIDILVNIPAGAAGEGSSDRVMPVLENVEVLATGREAAYEYEERMLLIQGGVAARPVTNFTAITINVTPKEAALVETAQDKGDLLALLRNRRDASGSGFTDIVPGDLATHADELAQHAAIREKSASVEKQGLVVGEDGLIRTKDGVVLKDQNLIVGEDGKIRTKDGVVLSGRGLTINEKGELVTADGTVVSSDDIVVAADGSIMTADGKVLGGPKDTLRAAGKALPAAGLKVAEDGTVTDKDGNIVQGVTVDKNGNVLKNGKVLAGVKLDANGNMVDENGNPVVVTESGVVLKGATTDENGEIVRVAGAIMSSKDLVVAADGTVMTKDGKKLAGIRIDKNGNTVDENGNPVVVTESGIVLKGATTNAKGEIVLADGTVVAAKDLLIGEDGTVSTRDGGKLAGITADVGAIATALATEEGAQPAIGRYDFMAGGVSKDGVATVNKVPYAD